MRSAEARHCALAVAAVLAAALPAARSVPEPVGVARRSRAERRRAATHAAAGRAAAPAARRRSRARGGAPRPADRSAGRRRGQRASAARLRRRRAGRCAPAAATTPSGASAGARRRRIPSWAAPHANLGLIQRQAGKLPEAVAALETRRAGSARASRSTGTSSASPTARQGQFAKARDAYEKAIALDAGYARRCSTSAS